MPPVILFDGVCNLCNGLVDFVIRHDVNGRFRFAPLQSSSAVRLLTDLGLESPDEESVILVSDGRVYTFSDAVLEAVRLLGFPWSLLGAGRVVPRRWRDALYRWIASRRYRWFGRRGTCRVPAPEEESRFLNSDSDPPAAI